MKMQLLAGVFAGATLVGAAAQAQQTITAVHAFPETLIYTQSFLSFVDAVNEAGEGVIQIDVRGGPEAIGMFQQPDAVRDGIGAAAHVNLDHAFASLVHGIHEGQEALRVD